MSVNLNSKWLEHALSTLLVSTVLLLLFYHFNSQQSRAITQKNKVTNEWLALGYLNFDSPLDRAILLDALQLFEPWEEAKHKKLMDDIMQFRQQQMEQSLTQTDKNRPVDSTMFFSFLLMYIKFIFIYAVSMLLIFYGARTMALYRFTRHQTEPKPYMLQLWDYIKVQEKPKNGEQFVQQAKKVLTLLGKGGAKMLAFSVLFAPAYVLAYAFRTRFGTDMLPFMIVLGVLSNGILIGYSHKFYTFLVSESRKGYVQTARVKNLLNSYMLNAQQGISLKELFAWNKKFKGHILGHIYENAARQYTQTVKEQGSFLISCLIIIEMALNIQNHLSYELLQNMLYKNYAFATLIVLGIYYLVKGTEIMVDFWVFKAENKVSNYEQGNS